LPGKFQIEIYVTGGDNRLVKFAPDELLAGLGASGCRLGIVQHLLNAAPQTLRIAYFDDYCGGALDNCRFV
jgi:hypothetical protein